MFTLKLYKNGPLELGGRTEIFQTTGIWINHCPNGVKEVHVFQAKVGVGPSDTFYVGGEPMPAQDAIHTGDGGNWYDWGVLENPQGKTTEMIR